jgi:hypothetical protein
MFTLYGDTAPASSPNGHGDLEQVHSYALRDDFFRQLQELYACICGVGLPSSKMADEQRLPIACVVSIRQEFIADLDPLRAFVGDLDQWSFHLDRLQADVAKEVLLDMTRCSASPFSTDLAARIVSGLTREGSYVDPAELQVVTGRILNEWEALQIKASDGALPLDLPAVFEALGEGPLGQGTENGKPSDRDLVRNILNRFFREFLDRAVSRWNQPEQSDQIRVELLEILQSLVTDRGKAPAPVFSLINAPFRDRRRRQSLIDILDEGRILRKESKNGVVMAEIRHDFLIKPIQRAVREGLMDDQHGRLVSAQAVLRFRIQAASADAARNLLTRREFEDIARHKGSLNWNYREPGWRWTPGELMLRSALTIPKIGADALTECVNLLEENTEGTSTYSVPTDWKSEILNHQKLRALNKSPEDWRLSSDQLLVIIRSHIEMGGELDRPHIQYWTNRWQEQVKEDQNAGTV